MKPFLEGGGGFSPCSSALSASRRAERRRHGRDFQKVQPAAGRGADVQVRATLLGVLGGRVRESESSGADHFPPSPPSLSELEQLLCTCNGFVYLATERLARRIPPAKLAALSLSGSRRGNHLTFIFVKCFCQRSSFTSAAACRGERQENAQN